MTVQPDVHIEEIATAPKGSGYILLFKANPNRAESLETYCEVAYWDGVDWKNCETGLGAMEGPTHWMHLPNLNGGDQA